MNKTFINTTSGETRTYREWQKMMSPTLIRNMLAMGKLVDAAKYEPELTEDDDPITASLPSGARSASFEAERAGRLTDLQEIITAAVVAKNAVGDDPLAAEIAEMTGYNVFVVSGALSSLVEKGYLRTRKVAGKACYFRTSNA